MDGKGYPDGISISELPRSVAIVAAVDAYYAMMADRPHRKALSREKALEIIKKGSGTQFDPQVVEKVIKLLGNDEIPDRIIELTAFAG